MNLPGKAKRMVSALFPWPTRDQRRKAIAQARRDRIAAERQAQKARTAREHLDSLASVNHIAEAIAAQIRRKER